MDVGDSSSLVLLPSRLKLLVLLLRLPRAPSSCVVVSVMGGGSVGPPSLLQEQHKWERKASSEIA